MPTIGWSSGCWLRRDMASVGDDTGWTSRGTPTREATLSRERRYPYAYTYRDYVIGALNEDVPFDRFVLEQLAADQLELGEDNRAWRRSVS